MIPLVALSGALSAVDKMSSGAASIWQHLSSSSHPGPKQTQPGQDFASVLSEQCSGTASQLRGVGSASSRTP